MKKIHFRSKRTPTSGSLQFFLLGVSTLLLAGDLVHGADCLQWIKRTDVGSYGQRYQHAMAYDSDRGVTVFFGGEIGTTFDATYFNDTQEYDGKQWKQINTAVKPPVRSQHSMTYDPVRKKIVLFGGFRSAPATRYRDTWLYTGDGVNGFWELQPQAGDPSGALVGSESFAWDPVAGVALLYSGGTWSWDGTTWALLAGGSSSLVDYGFGFDTERSTVMILGGKIFDPDQGFPWTPDVWEKPPGSGWQNRGPGPSARAELAIAYDERRKRMVMVGGAGHTTETGETAYEHIAGTGWITLPSLPSGQGRAGAKMVYDSKRGVMVLTGGAGGGAPNAEDGGRYSDTWELWPSLFISSHPSNATNFVCTTATFSVLALGAEPFQYQWRLDGAPVTDGTHFSGSTTAELRVNGVRHTHAGKYDVVVRDSCHPPNVVTSRVATLTLKPDSEWVLRATNGPPPRFGHAMAYDSTRRVTVLFGGRTNWNVFHTMNDLWEWDGTRWMLRMPGSVTNGWTNVPGRGWQPSHRDRPVPRAHHAMAYDSRRGRVVVFGGLGLDPGGTTSPLNDLWEWDGTRWYFRATNGPVSRVHGSMAYDDRRGRTVLFGGQSFGPGNPDTELVWEWDGYQWHTNAPPVNPTGVNSRTQARMTYDSFRGVTVFGPTAESYSLWSFWDWDGVKWTNFPVLHFTDPVVTVLHGTVSGGFAFDSNRRRSVWFGGSQGSPANHTALYDGKQWALFTNTPPAKRTLPAMAYDSDRRVTVMFGGSLTAAGAFGATNDTWELASVDVPAIQEQPASQLRVVGEPVTFRVQAAGHGLLSYQWYFGNTPIAGALGNSLIIPSVDGEDVGEYRVEVSDECGSTSSRVANLTLNQQLQLFYSGSTTTLLWPPDPNLVLEAAESVIGPWSAIANAPNPFSVGASGRARFFRLRPVE